MKNPFYFILILLCPFFVNGQVSSQEDLFLEQLIALDFENATKEIKKFPNSSYTNYYRALKQVIFNNGQEKKKDSTTILTLAKNESSLKKSILSELIYGYYHLYNSSFNNAALQNFITCSNLANEEVYLNFKKLALIGILELYISQHAPNTDEHKSYLKQYLSIKTNNIDEILIAFYINRYNGLDVHNPNSFYDSSKELIKIINTIKLSKSLRGRLIDDIAVYYRDIEAIEEAITYANQNTNLPNNNYNRKLLFGAHLELSALHAMKKDTAQVNFHLNKAKDFFSKSDSLRSSFTMAQFKGLKVYKSLKVYDSAFFAMEKALKEGAVLNFIENKERINELKVQLNTAEKEKQLLISNQQKKQNRNIAYGLGGAAVLIGFIGFLAYKNTKRKQRIAEQERLLEIQQKEKILKEQELHTINAMVEGQEKERLRLASDLHDSVGATLSAAKLQFDHLSKNISEANPKEEIFQKTKKLLEDAYQEVRSMAHLKNSGVIAKNGLLPAVEKLAANASSKELHIEVSHFGLEGRLDSTLEITLFRIIQELVTNIIKHAKASEASISLTQREDVLSIIVEDNGIGFSTNKIVEKNGMGLSSVETRVEHLEGTLEVDSQPQKGTSILIDIPL